jgi:hypothetical protein
MDADEGPEVVTCGDSRRRGIYQISARSIACVAHVRAAGDSLDGEPQMTRCQTVFSGACDRCSPGPLSGAIRHGGKHRVAGCDPIQTHTANVSLGHHGHSPRRVGRRRWCGRRDREGEPRIIPVRPVVGVELTITFEVDVTVSVCRSMPPILAASMRDAPSSTAAIASSRRACAASLARFANRRTSPEVSSHRNSSPHGNLPVAILNHNGADSRITARVTVSADWYKP